ncbi:MAG: zf-HC2 domain-containing protein [Firmicutes bacterium]|nr:zf-HC2 domain-containing protein [Bacillota bacterium]
MKETNYKINCRVIRDILPLYVDGVVSEDTSALVEEHLTECEACRQEAERMKAHLNLPDSGEVEAAEARVIKNFGKAFRKKSRINALKAAGSFLLVAIAAWVLNWLFFSFGVPIDWRLILEIINTKMFMATLFIGLIILGSIQLKLDERSDKKTLDRREKGVEAPRHSQNSDDTMDRMAGSFAGMNLDPEKEEKPKNPIGKFYFGKTSRRGNIKRIIWTEKNIMEDRMKDTAKQKSGDDREQ